MRPILVFLLAFATPATAADQFDLVCSGTEENTSALQNRHTVEPWEAVIRIDLENGRYCMAACQGTTEIYEVSDTRIEFAEPHERDFRRGSSAFYVRRTTGELVWYNFPGSGVARQIEAQCAPGPFSGFPPVERQF